MAMLKNEKIKLLKKTKDELLDGLLNLTRKHRTKAQIINDIEAMQKNYPYIQKTQIKFASQGSI
jgi:hypothetical protein